MHTSASTQMCASYVHKCTSLPTLGEGGQCGEGSGRGETWQQIRERNSECGDGHGCEEGSQGEREEGRQCHDWTKALVSRDQGPLWTKAPCQVKAQPCRSSGLAHLERRWEGRYPRSGRMGLGRGQRRRGQEKGAEGMRKRCRAVWEGAGQGVIQPLGPIFLEYFFPCGLWICIVWRRGCFSPKEAGIR